MMNLREIMLAIFIALLIAVLIPFVALAELVERIRCAARDR